MTQEEFDYTLVEGFYVAPDAPMWRVCGNEASHQHLKRMYHPYFANWSIARYVCERLPKLANVLWKSSKKDIKRIARILSKSDYMPIQFSQAEINKNKEGYGRSLRQRYIVEDGTRVQIRNTKYDGKHGWKVCS